MKTKINILGTEYEYEVVKNIAAKELDGAGGGITKFFEKKIFINGDNDVLADYNRIVRHEILHAFFFESGLSEYARDEKIIDFLAYQIPKIVDIYKNLEKNEQE